MMIVIASVSIYAKLHLIGWRQKTDLWKRESVPEPKATKVEIGDERVHSV